MVYLTEISPFRYLCQLKVLGASIKKCSYFLSKTYVVSTQNILRVLKHMFNLINKLYVHSFTLNKNVYRDQWKTYIKDLRALGTFI